MSITMYQSSDGDAAGFYMSEPGGVLSVISIGSFVQNKIGAARYRAIVTDHTVEEASHANVMYSADGHIYMHVAGDKLGSLTVSGTAFAWVCDDENIGQEAEENDGVGERSAASDDEDKRILAKLNFNDNMTGFERILRWYRFNRVSNPYKNEPIEITFGGGSVLRGYLGSFRASVADVANRLYSFTLPMYLAPAPTKNPGIHTSDPE